MIAVDLASVPQGPATKAHGWTHDQTRHTASSLSSPDERRATSATPRGYPRDGSEVGRRALDVGIRRRGRRCSHRRHVRGDRLMCVITPRIWSMPNGERWVTWIVTWSDTKGSG